jgi:hypothetical protein
LELIRLKQLVCAQTEAFDEIEIRPAPVSSIPKALATHLSESFALAAGNPPPAPTDETHPPSD